jgi:hypothetical protein
LGDIKIPDDSVIAIGIQLRSGLFSVSVSYFCPRTSLCSKVSGDMVRLMCSWKLFLMFSFARKLSTSCSRRMHALTIESSLLVLGTSWDVEAGGCFQRCVIVIDISWYEDLPCAVSSLRCHRSPCATAPGHWPSDSSNDRRSLCLQSSFVLSRGT